MIRFKWADVPGGSYSRDDEAVVLSLPPLARDPGRRRLEIDSEVRTERLLVDRKVESDHRFLNHSVEKIQEDLVARLDRGSVRVRVPAVRVDFVLVAAVLGEPGKRRQIGGGGVDTAGVERLDGGRNRVELLDIGVWNSTVRSLPMPITSRCITALT